MAGVTLEIKSFGPKRLKVKEFAETFKVVLRQEGEETRQDYKLPVQTWKGAKPFFDSRVTITSTVGKVFTRPTRNKEGIKKFNILDLGARPHTIRARRARRLRFRQGGFVAKTSPGRLESSGGKVATGPIRRPVQVRHPGIKARGWTELILKRRQKRFPLLVKEAIRKQAKDLWVS